MNKIKLTLKYVILVMSLFNLHVNNLNAEVIDSQSIFKIEQFQLNIPSTLLFESEFLIGVVYEDVNQNNIQDDNETGIAGVRLFTVTGNQVQTDGNGRFNLPIDLSRSQRARKLLIKLDTSSLPSGYTVSTENPLLIHNGFSTPVSVNFAIIKK